MSDSPRTILYDVIRERGNTIFKNQTQFSALLNDLSNGAFKKERRCIIEAIIEGIPDALLEGKLPFSLLSSQLTQKLINSGFDKDLAQWTVDSWALALGIIREESLIKRTSSITIVSNPAGAEVFVNDEKIGKAPVQISDLNAARYSVNVHLEGYHPWFDTIHLSEGERKTVHANLTNATPHGEILIDSDPKGAVILIDGDHQGETPKQIHNLTTGSHELSLSSSNYETFTKKITIKKGKNPDICSQLKPRKQPHKPSKKAQIAIDSYPSNAEIFLDGNYVGTTSTIIKRLDPKRYNLTLKLSGFPDFTTIITLEEGKNPDFFWRFERQRESSKKTWKTYGVITISAAMLFFLFFGFIQFPPISHNETQPAAIPTDPIMDKCPDCTFLPEDRKIVDTLSTGYLKTYYFFIDNPEVIRLIRIRLESNSDFDFIVGREYVPSFSPKHFDQIADIGLLHEEIDIENPEKGIYYVTIRNKGVSPDYSINKVMFYN